MQNHHVNRFKSLGLDCLDDMTHLAVSQWKHSRRINDVAVVEEKINYRICQGRSGLIDNVMGILAFKGVRYGIHGIDGKGKSVESYVARLRVLETLEAKNYRCGQEDCEECSRAWDYLNKNLRWHLGSSLRELADDGLCLQCVKQNRPFTDHRLSPCRIHKLG